ncbi:sugar ABC transporter substrate-binding protein [Actinotalea sp. C106]|uniref:ABC transporter substrate-binding protein n=1 Tax=Actinotalea sp. C106 TaxID=2908644 RepID=UPI0020278621|nr:sugar ABC transporter substrate-binding protein [Actinotalea sp. C106]
MTATDKPTTLLTPRPTSLPSRRSTVGALAALAVTLPLGACAAGAADAAQGEELTVLLISSHEGASEWLAETYEEETGVRINPVIVPYDEIAAKLTLDQQSGANTIDVAAPWYVSIGDLAADGVIQDLTDWIEETPDLDTEDFIPSIYDAYTQVGDRRYGLPFDGDTHVLFYNTEILARNGFDAPPATWDEYLEQVETITENESGDGVYGAAVFGQKSPLILGASYANRLAGYGGSFLDESGTPSVDTPEAVAAAQALVDIWPHAFPTPGETAFGEGNSAWLDGSVAFIENWTDLGVVSQSAESGSTVADGWGVTTLPVGGDATESRASLVAGFTWTVTANTEETELAQDFIAWAASAEVNEALLTAEPPTGIDPNRVSSLESESYGTAFPELQEANRATLTDSLAWPTGEHAAQLAQILTDELAKLLAGQGGTAQETMERVQAEWERTLGD